MKNLSIIIPFYNEQLVAEKMLQRTIAVAEKIEKYTTEIICVNDGSTDNTKQILDNFASQNKNIKTIHFSRNFGHQAAVTAGLHHCNGNIAIIIDADLQDPPELFIDMIALYEKENANVVYAVRKERDGETYFKKLTAKLYYRLLNFLSEVPLPLDTGDFRLIDKTIIEEFKKLKEKHKFLRGLFAWMGYKQVPIYYNRDNRFAGKTKYSVQKMIKFALFGLIYFSKKPLKISISLGIISVSIGIIMLVYNFVKYILYPNTMVMGWMSIVTIIIFFGGIQLLTLGILGEYIGNIFDEVKDRPEYLIQETKNL